VRQKEIQEHLLKLHEACTGEWMTKDEIMARATTEIPVVKRMVFKFKKPVKGVCV